MQLFGNKLHLNSQKQPEDPEGKLDYASLIEGCRSGDRLSQKALYDALSRKMFAVCLRYMGDRDAAEDVLQDGFVTLFSKLDSFSRAGSFEGWARKIFVNTALMSLRRKDVLRGTEEVDAAFGLSEDSPTPVQQIGYKELMELIAALPSDSRTIFNMYVIEGYSHKEIAQTLGLNEATTRSKLQRARLRLQEMIKEREKK